MSITDNLKDEVVRLSNRITLLERMVKYLATQIYINGGDKEELMEAGYYELPRHSVYE